MPSLLQKFKQHALHAVLPHIHAPRAHIKHHATNALHHLARMALSRAHPSAHRLIHHAHQKAHSWLQGRGFWSSLKSIFKKVAPYAVNAIGDEITAQPVWGALAKPLVSHATNYINGKISGMGLRKGQKPACNKLVKGSLAAKRHMAHLRAMKGSLSKRSNHGMGLRRHSKKKHSLHKRHSSKRHHSKRGSALNAMGY